MTTGVVSNLTEQEVLDYIHQNPGCQMKHMEAHFGLCDETILKTANKLIGSGDIYRKRVGKAMVFLLTGATIDTPRDYTTPLSRALVSQPWREGFAA